jgi:hypothetical protein
VRYAKAIAAIIGGAATAAIGIVPPHTQTWMILEIASAACTAAGVYLVPNTPNTPAAPKP